MIDQDIKQRIKVVGIFLLQSYKVLTGTMLSIFIPQSCGDKMCTLKENYNNIELYHQILFYWNTLSMSLFLASYFIELKREKGVLSNSQKLWQLQSNTLNAPHFIIKGNIKKCLTELAEIIDKYVPKRNKNFR